MEAACKQVATVTRWKRGEQSYCLANIVCPFAVAVKGCKPAMIYYHIVKFYQYPENRNAYRNEGY